MMGFGTATLKGNDVVEASCAALKAGFRHLDCALLYGNQPEVAEGLAKSGVKREDVFITSKVAFFPRNSEGVWMYNEKNCKGGEEASIDLCLEMLKTDHVELMLIHNPAT
jgi:diketogulonate reductase-like aldo/keto reductase